MKKRIDSTSVKQKRDQKKSSKKEKNNLIRGVYSRYIWNM